MSSLSRTVLAQTISPTSANVFSGGAELLHLALTHLRRGVSDAGREQGVATPPFSEQEIARCASLIERGLETLEFRLGFEALKDILSEDREASAILDVLHDRTKNGESGFVSQHAIARQMNLSQSTVSRRLLEMQRFGLTEKPDGRLDSHRITSLGLHVVEAVREDQVRRRRMGAGD